MAPRETLERKPSSFQCRAIVVIDEMGTTFFLREFPGGKHPSFQCGVCLGPGPPPPSRFSPEVATVGGG